MIKQRPYTSPYSSSHLVETYSDTANCLKQLPTGLEFGCSAIDVENSEYEYEETERLDLSEDVPNYIIPDISVHKGYTYTDNGNNLYRCIKTGKCEDLTDTEYFRPALKSVSPTR